MTSLEHLLALVEVNSDCDFCGLRLTATITSSKWRAVRSMMSR